MDILLDISLTIRIVNGKALHYSKTSKPPMRELEVTPETVLLACQSKTDATLEKTGKTTAVMEMQLQVNSPGILTHLFQSSVLVVQSLGLLSFLEMIT